MVFTNINDPDLQRYLKNNTYIKWGDPDFWVKLKRALRKKTKRGWINNKKIYNSDYNISDNSPDISVDNVNEEI